MKSFISSLVLGLSMASSSQAVEILRWNRLPLSVPLVVGQERVVFVDRSIRIGVPASLDGRLRVQSAGGAIYLRANAPIEPTRLQLQDANTGALILIDITAVPANATQEPLEPIRIIDGERAAAQEENHEPKPSVQTPIPVVLTRYAAQALYAPLRTIEPVPGIAQVPLRPDLASDTLLPTLPIHTKALAAWRLGEHWITAVKLTNAGRQWLDLDPRALQGNFIAATFQHSNLGPTGDSTDTTVVYLVTRGHGLAEALLPSVNAIDAARNPPTASLDKRHHHDDKE